MRAISSFSRACRRGWADLRAATFVPLTREYFFLFEWLAALAQYRGQFLMS